MTFSPNFLRRLGLGAAVVALALAAPAAVEANSALRGIMHTWRRDLRTSDDMLSGRTPFDANTVRATLSAYMRDASRIATQINGQSADSRDIRRRFETLQADAQQALQHVGQPAVLRGDFHRIVSTCQSCHDAYN